MGQQQLLLLVLGIVIVGLAVVVGIQAFGENQKKANADAMTNDAIRIASDGQAWSLKPKAFGGGDGGVTGLTLAKLGYEVTGADNAAIYKNLNADPGYTLTLGTGYFSVAGSNTKTGNFVRSDIWGTGPNCIITTVAAAAPAASSAKPAGCTSNY